MRIRTSPRNLNGSEKNTMGFLRPYSADDLHDISLVLPMFEDIKCIHRFLDLRPFHSHEARFVPCNRKQDSPKIGRISQTNVLPIITSPPGANL